MASLLSFKSPTRVNLAFLIPVLHSGAFIPFTDLHQKTFCFCCFFPKTLQLDATTERKQCDSFLIHKS